MTAHHITSKVMLCARMPSLIDQVGISGVSRGPKVLLEQGDVTIVELEWVLRPETVLPERCTNTTDNGFASDISEIFVV